MARAAPAVVVAKHRDACRVPRLFSAHSSACQAVDSACDVDRFSGWDCVGMLKEGVRAKCSHLVTAYKGSFVGSGSPKAKGDLEMIEERRWMSVSYSENRHCIGVDVVSDQSLAVGYLARRVEAKVELTGFRIATNG